MDILMSKQPSYIRCIKPNDFKRDGVFDESIIRHQAKYLGLMENLRVRRAGFCYRRNLQYFLQRYKCLCPATWPRWTGSPVDGVQKLCEHLRYKSDQYKLGKTKIFIRFPQTLFDIEDKYQLRKHELVTTITAKWRMYILRKKYRQLREAQIVFSKHWKRILTQRMAQRYRQAAVVVRKFIKGFITRNQPPCPENMQFLEFVRTNWLNRLAKALPKNVLDKNWPSSPPACREASDILQAVYYRLMVRGYTRGLTEERKQQLQMKLEASELFKGKKSCYENSVGPYFQQSHLSAQEAKVQGTFHAKFPDIPQPRFSLPCVKYDRHGYKPRPRLLELSDSAIVVYEGSSLKVKEIGRAHV